MRIGLSSKEFINGDIQKNMNTIKNTMLKNRNLDLIVFPEAFLHGFDGITFNYNIDKNRALSINSLIIQELQHNCNKLSLGLGFGYIELHKNNIYSSFIVIDKYGKIVDNYRRISPGWKEVYADHHYLEGNSFKTFNFQGKKFVTAICGDLWFDENIKKLHELDYDYILWPNYNSYEIKQWENSEKNDYAKRAELIGKDVFWFNSHNNCQKEKAYGGAIHFKKGQVYKELPMGKKGVLKIEL